MNLMEQAPLVLSMTAWGIGMLSWFYGIVELVAVQQLAPWAFRAGRLVVRETRSSPPPIVGSVPKRVVKTRRGKVRFLSATECLFCEQFLRGMFQAYTPFPIKGRIIWKGMEVRVEGRIPIGSSLFFVCVLSFCTGVMIVGIVKTSHLTDGLVLLGILLGIWTFTALIYRGCVSFEKRRILEVAAEILHHQPWFDAA
jgi:hypothetical protein